MCRPTGLVLFNNAYPGLTSWATFVSSFGLRTKATADKAHLLQVRCSDLKPLRRLQTPIQATADKAHLRQVRYSDPKPLRRLQTPIQATADEVHLPRVRCSDLNLYAVFRLRYKRQRTRSTSARYDAPT
jgi:hypothetical protein